VEGSQPVWFVTGLGDVGVERAARTLDPTSLRNAFAVAVTPTARLRLPLVSG
jgi:hypothetical protein